MNIQYIELEGKIIDDYAIKLLNLKNEIFTKGNDEFVNKINIFDKKDLYSVFAFSKDELVGYKIGYATETTTFYSWLGGVHPSFRKNGIASTLFKIQHERCFKKGYEFITTQSSNKYKEMMRLNLKFGFEIYGIKMSDNIQILFRKNL